MTQPAIHYVLAQDLPQLYARQPDLLLVDVREPEAFKHYHLPDSQCIPLSKVESGDLDASLNDSMRPILLICAKGGRAHTAADILRDRIPNPLTVLLGGLLACIHADLPLDGHLH